MALLHLLTLLVLQPGLGSDPEQVLPRVKNSIEVAPDGVAKPSVSDISSRSGKIPQRVKGSVPVTKSLAEAAAHIPEKLFRSGQIVARTEDPDGSDDAKEEGGGGDDAARRSISQVVADCRACKKKCRKNRHHREECREKCSKNVCSPEAKGTTEGTADGTADSEQANENGGAEGSAEGDSGNESDDEGTAEGGLVPVVAVPVVEPVVPVVEPVVPVVEPVVAPVVPVVEPLVAVEPVVAVVPTKTGGGSLVESAAHIPEKLIRSRTQDPDSGEANSLVAKTEDPEGGGEEGGGGDDAEGGSDSDGGTNDANSTDKEKDDAEEAEGSAFRGALPGAACLIGLVAILA